METRYPTQAEALELHVRLIDRFGGAHGVRDLGLLDSALARPGAGYYSSLSEQAAALFQSVALNHCFVDGNKRAAFALAAVFLRMNGVRLRVDSQEGERFLIDEIIMAKVEVKAIGEWLEAHSETADAPESESEPESD